MTVAEGKDGSGTVHPIETDTSGKVEVTGTVTVDTTLLAKDATLAAFESANHTDLAAILAKQPSSPALETGHLAAIDTATAASKTDLDTIAAAVAATGAAAPTNVVSAGGFGKTAAPSSVSDGSMVTRWMSRIGVAATFLSDGVGTAIASVKAASTAASATDPALVVAISPNNSVAMKPVADATPATGNITVVDSGSATTTGANSQSIITGTPTASSFVSFTLSSQETVQVQITGTWTGTIQLEVSSDGGTTWYPRSIHQVGTSMTAASFTANFAGGANVGGYTQIRARATAAMTGTAVVGVTESLNSNIIYIANPIKLTDGTNPLLPAAAAEADAETNATLVSRIGSYLSGFNGTTWDRLRTAQQTATATLTGILNTLPWGVYNAAAPTLTTGQGTTLQLDSLANLLMNMYTKLAGEDLANDVMKVEGQFSYLNIVLAAPTTTTVKSGAGLLHSLTFNTPIAASVVTIYDNTAASGTKIGTITLPNPLLQEGPYTAIYDVKFATGLTIVTGTAASDITVSYR